MDRNLALNIIREQRIPDGQELQTYKTELLHEFGGFQNEEEQLDDFDRWLEDEHFYKRMQEINHWSSL